MIQCPWMQAAARLAWLPARLIERRTQGSALICSRGVAARGLRRGGQDIRARLPGTTLLEVLGVYSR